jgi:hypothetical protein
MINLDIEVLVNGRPIKIDSRLNDLISSYLVEKIGGLEQTPILDHTTPKKYPSARVYGEKPRTKISWTDDEILVFAEKATELRKQGLSYREVAEKLGPDFKNRSGGAMFQKMVELKKKGLINVV